MNVCPITLNVSTLSAEIMRLTIRKSIFCRLELEAIIAVLICEMIGLERPWPIVASLGGTYIR